MCISVYLSVTASSTCRDLLMYKTYLTPADFYSVKILSVTVKYREESLEEKGGKSKVKLEKNEEKNLMNFLLPATIIMTLAFEFYFHFEGFLAAFSVLQPLWPPDWKSPLPYPSRSKL